MTPAEIQNKKFDKGMGGYKTEDVHQYLNQVAAEMASMEDEREELLEKMEVLAEKLEQYREDEESLRAALVGAQKLGNSVVRESQRKAEAIIAQAVSQAEQIVQDAQRNIDKEALALKRMQRDVASFREKIIRLYSEHLEMIQSLPDDDSWSDEPEIAQITYTPPRVEVIETGPEDEHPDMSQMDTAQLTEVGRQYEAATVAAESTAASAVAEEQGPARKSKTRKYGHLNEFFGDDKPLQRNEK